LVLVDHAVPAMRQPMPNISPRRRAYQQPML
jgi:hypothetical protein